VFITALYTIDGAKGPGSASKSLGIPTPPNFKDDIKRFDNELFY